MWDMRINLSGKKHCKWSLIDSAKKNIGVGGGETTGLVGSLIY